MQNVICLLILLINNDLVNISEWMVANKLSLNASKTECMLIGSHKKLQQNRNDFLIEIDKAPTECVNVSKSLGVIIDETLSWHCHVDLITKKVSLESSKSRFERSRSNLSAKKLSKSITETF